MLIIQYYPKIPLNRSVNMDVNLSVHLNIHPVIQLKGFFQPERWKAEDFSWMELSTELCKVQLRRVMYLPKWPVLDVKQGWAIWNIIKVTCGEFERHWLERQTIWKLHWFFEPYNLNKPQKKHWPSVYFSTFLQCFQQNRRLIHLSVM